MLLYSGTTGGSRFNAEGGGSNYLCLPGDPDYLAFTPGSQSSRTILYGTEYQFEDNPPPPLGDLHDYNAPCALCYTDERAAKIMIPAKTSCPSSWTREYYGYLMSDYEIHYRTMFECVDVNAEPIPGTEASIDGGVMFYFTESSCHGINCPPYVQGQEITCVVCTK